MQKKWIAGLMAAVLAPAAVFAAGVSQNEVVYNAKNESVNGTYKEPVKEGAEFLGWATTKEKADAGEVDFKANPEDPSNTDLNQIEGGTKTVYAAWWPYNAKWAVALYGIDQDMEKMGGGTYTHTMTFGPATGGNYVSAHKDAHIAVSLETDSDKCIHNHSWDEIIALCRTNPHVFDKCVKAGCTKTVNLDINDTLKGGGWKDDYLSKETGDGPSLLRNELHDEFRVWQPGTAGSGAYAHGNNDGGYPASRIRAILNGYDWTSDSSHGNTTILTPVSMNNIYTRSDEAVDSGWTWRRADLTELSTITSKNCLLSCFPKNLQEAIVPKTVKSGTSARFGYNLTTWDKLWLFSGKEMYVDSGEHNKVISSNEGMIYDRIREQNITTSDATGNLGYRADGSTESWWLRSFYRGYWYYEYAVWSPSGESVGYYTASVTPGVAPGFVIGK